MAAARTQMKVGSATWIHAEKENMMQLLSQEKEELVYPAQHEMEWLNEHMAEIFSKSRFNVTDVFKTPGKLRGKTPRTGRKRHARESRIPLSDIFSSKPQAGLSPRHTSTPPKSVTALDIAQVAQEVGEIENAPVPPKQYTDSGYHGSTEDEMEAHIPVPLLSSGPPKLVDRGLHEPPGDVVQHSAGPASAERRTTEGSFHSAREDVPAKVSFAIAGMKEDDGDISRQSERPNKETSLQTDLENLHDKEMGVGPVSVQGPDLVRELDEIGSPSDGSTPDRPLVRKSSLTFASLPAREPLTTKKSVGARESRTSHLGQAMHGSSNYFRKQTGASYLASTEFQRNGLVDQMMSDADRKSVV